MIKKTPCRVLFASIALTAFLLLGAAHYAFADETASRDSEDAVKTANGEPPILVKFLVKPNQITKNSKKKLRLIIKYKDKDQNLDGGSLELTISESNGYSRDFSIPLEGDKFGKKKSRVKIKLAIITGNCDWAKFTATLKDAAENGSNQKEVTKNTKGSGGPEWGTKLGERAKGFTLVDQHGNEVSLHDYWGKVVLISFGNFY